MPELFVIKRTDTDQYYHSLTPRGTMLWIDDIDEACWLTKQQAKRLRDDLNGGVNPKYHTYVFVDQYDTYTEI